VEFFKGLEPILKSLANDYQLGILSSNSQENIGKFLKSKKLEIFDFVYTGSNLFAKDKIFKKIIRQEQLNKNQILYFGDEIRDIEACQKLGIKIAAVTWGFDDLEILKKAKPDYLISKPKEIKKILSI
jgi:phosphoglycolate phosphatase